MWILPLVGYLGVLLGFGFLTLAIASGLYYLSELVEEHTVQAKKLLTRLIYGIISIQLLLALVDGFPFLLSCLSIGSHVVYAGNLRRFPIVRLSDPIFILSCGVSIPVPFPRLLLAPPPLERPNSDQVLTGSLQSNLVLVLLNHYFWFRHFSHPGHFPRSTPYHRPFRTSPTTRFDTYLPAGPTFTEVASYCGICVWLVPFSLFVSLSAGENVLPSMGSEYATGDPNAGGGADNVGGVLGRDGRRKGGRGRGLVKVAVDGVRERMGQVWDGLGFWRDPPRRRF